VAVPRPTSPPSTSLREIAISVGGRWSGADVTVTGVTLDSRAVAPGDLYAALPGSRAHGADFAVEAMTAGALAVLSDATGADRMAAAGVLLPTLVVEDPRAALGVVAARIFDTERTAVRLIGVTGTNGKTTVAHLVYSALVALGRRAGLVGTVETRIGSDRLPSARTTPEAPEVHSLLAVMAERGVDACVMEVSSHALALHRVDGVRYDLALFTNLSRDHLDFHGGMEQYFAAKASLFTPARASQGLVCVDDEWGVRLAESASIPVTTLTTRSDRTADWRVERGSDPAAFRLRGATRVLHLESALPGDFNVTNTAMAATALLLLGEDPAAVTAAVRADPRVPGRMERVSPPPGVAAPRAIVDYAHTPDAIRAALTALRPTTPGRLVCVTGAGGDRDRDKRAAMGAAAGEVADVVVVTDDNPRSEDPATVRAGVLAGLDDIRRSGRVVEVSEVADRRDAIRSAVAMAWPDGPDATVAVVGKGHESGQDIGGVIHPFDDRDELRAALSAVAEAMVR
jgi:UDP-N-acetylmuramoyl-L-alanyl-D-glutamate--2,6-diaminopimelate ligase